MNDLAVMDASAEVDRARRFGGIARLYGEAALSRLETAHVCVVGIGGVGSWAAEALARSGVGALTLVDLDHVAESNINRQAHALETTLGQAKVDAMKARIYAINPQAQVTVVDDFLTAENALEIVRGADVVIDAIDQVRAKFAIVQTCRSVNVPVIVVGGAGGKLDPARIGVADLARTQQDPLLARLRRMLRSEAGFPRDPKRKFGVDAIYSEEPMQSGRMDEACAVDGAPQGLSCAGYGSSMMVTASFGLQAAARAVTLVLERPSAAA